MGIKRSILFLLIFIYSVSPGQPKQGSVLIKNGTVITVTQGTKENTDILIINGKIERIGKSLTVPQNIRVLDATGLYVMPGIIDAHSHITLEDPNEETNPVTAEVRIGDATNSFDINIYRALAGGVTTIQVLHGSANPIGGECETLKLRYGAIDPEELKMEGAPRSIKFALGENPTHTHGMRHVMPRTRMGVEFIIRKALSEAKEYTAKWDAYKKNLTRKGFKGAPPAYSARMETLAEVLRGNIIVNCHSYRADEIYMMLKVCKDFGIKKIIFQHANEGFKIAPELKAYGAMASVFADWWSYKFEVYYSTAYNAAILTRNGVLTSINSDNADELRHLYHEASKTMKYGGLTEDEAIALVTINPAKQIGIDNRVGSLEIGKDGDIAIFQEHPMSIYTVPRYTLVDGVVRFDSENDPDDMRLYVDPNEELDNMSMCDHQQAHDRCMEGANEHKK